jgi:putative membrane protein
MTEKEEVLLSEDDALYRFTSKKKMLYALINIATASFFTAVFGTLAITVIGICKLMLQFDVFGTWGEYLLGSLLIVTCAMLLFSIFAFIGSLINSFIGYYNFSITKRGNEIRISYGLLERHTNTFSYEKIKAVKISQGIVQRMLGFATIKLEVIGYTTEGGENNNDVGILVPFCKFGEIDDILSKVLPDFIPDKKQSKAVSYFPFVSWFGLILSTVTLLVLLQAIISMILFNAPSSVTAGVALGLIGAAAAVFAVKALSALFCYKNNGIAIGDGKITAYSGGFIRNITVFKSKNLIAAENVTTPLRKRAGITTLVMHLKTNAGSNEVKVHIQDEKPASDLENLLII